MRILVVGSGGREHALCRTIAASPLCDALFCAPGNAGIARDATLVAIAADALDELVAFSAREQIDFVVVGPEGPLVAGLADRLREGGIRCFGPSAAAARLEGSKGFMKDLCARHGIPTAAYRRFDDAEAARAWVRERGAPIVVKADGLAGGKGVVVATTVEAALAAIDDAMVGGAFGAAGAELVIEEFLAGEEASFFALCDGEFALPLIAAQDHKRAFDGDEGPNTGGMGAYSPAPIVDPPMEARIMNEIVHPTIAAMRAEGAPFAGVLFVGLMIGGDGPKLIEFNVRFGDPECQVLMARLRSDVVPALLACAEGGLRHVSLRWRDEAALTVVMAAKGYPGTYARGSEIRGIEAAERVEGVDVLHAGTATRDDKLIAIGGRVLAVTARGRDVGQARARAYAAIDRIDWPGGFCRRDIGWRALARARAGA